MLPLVIPPPNQLANEEREQVKPRSLLRQLGPPTAPQNPGSVDGSGEDTLALLCGSGRAVRVPPGKPPSGQAPGAKGWSTRVPDPSTLALPRTLGVEPWLHSAFRSLPNRTTIDSFQGLRSSYKRNNQTTKQMVQFYFIHKSNIKEVKECSAHTQEREEERAWMRERESKDK